jgi:hypothetical protein
MATVTNPKRETAQSKPSFSTIGLVKRGNAAETTKRQNVVPAMTEAP